MPNQLATVDEGAPWQHVTDIVLFDVFSFLSPGALLKAAQVCHHWHQVALDEFLWKNLTHTTWKVDRSLPVAPGAYSWRQEFMRLHYHTPVVQDEVISEHRDQVLHASFSHDGALFATCSKDGFVKVWSTSYPVHLKFYADMKEFTWKYTQFSQFNKTDTLLLVSGVHFGSQSTSGEIAVFNLVGGGFELQCRVLNKPYDIFGTWYNERHLLSGNLHWLGNLTSCSVLWINKADQVLESEHEAVVRRLYKFRNVNASSIRTIMVAECQTEGTPSREGSADLISDDCTATSSSETNDSDDGILTDDSRESFCECDRNNTAPPMHAQSLPIMPIISIVSKTGQKSRVIQRVKSWTRCHKGETKRAPQHPPDDPDGAVGTSECSNCGLKINQKNTIPVPRELTAMERLHLLRSDGTSLEPAEWVTMLDKENESEREKLKTPAASLPFENETEKYLIFTMGTKTYTPHQIGIKKIDPLRVTNLMKTEVTQQRLLVPPGEEDQLDPEEEPEEEFDSLDYVLELNGHIIGMCLSPDQRKLYVNSRAWPQDYHIDHPLYPPPIAQEIDIHVIDLVALREVGVSHRAHRAYTPNDECFFIFLDVSQQYVASGAEDKHGYLWDRHYDVCLARFPHDDVVNGVAFNPRDPEMLVSVSDDHTLKVWRSRNRLKQRQERAYTRTTS